MDRCISQLAHLAPVRQLVGAKDRSTRLTLRIPWLEITLVRL